MAETSPNTAATPKVTQKPVASPSGIGMPKLEMFKFELPKMEVPEAYREAAENGIAQVQDGYEKIRTAAEEATDLLADTYATGSKGACSFGLKVIDSTRANSNAAFDLLGALMTVKSYSEVVELSASYMRNQFATVTTQAKELAECVQKVAAETADPIKEGITSAFRKAA
jgi:phasin